MLRNSIQGVTKGAIRRLARRGQVKRISGLVNEETRAVTKVLLEKVMRDTVTFTEHARRKTVSGVDMVTASSAMVATCMGLSAVIEQDQVQEAVEQMVVKER